MLWKRFAVAAMLAMAGGIWWLIESPAAPTEAQVAAVALAIYNDDAQTTLVTERRDLTLTQGFNEMRLTGIPRWIEPTSLWVAPEQGEDVQVLGQHYRFDAFNNDSVLAEYLGQPVELTTLDGSNYEGTLVNVTPDRLNDALNESSVILQDGDGQLEVVRLDQVRLFSLPDPEGALALEPTIFLELQADKAGKESVELSYLTRHLGWEASYVVRLSPDEATADFQSWMRIENTSGVDYRDATVTLVERESREVPTQDTLRAMVGLAPLSELPAASDPNTPSTQAEDAAEAARETPMIVRSYALPRPLTVASGREIQVEARRAEEVPVTKFYHYDGGALPFYGFLITDPAFAAGLGNRSVKIAYELANTRAAGLNVALPGGLARLYQTDSGGTPRLVGESEIEPVEAGDAIRLIASTTDDLIGERAPTNFRRIGDNIIEETYTITLRNRTDEAAEVRVTEHLFRWSDWSVLNESQKSTTTSPNTIEYRVTVPANGVATVSYTVRYTF